MLLYYHNVHLIIHTQCLPDSNAATGSCVYYGAVLEFAEIHKWWSQTQQNPCKLIFKFLSHPVGWGSKRLQAGKCRTIMQLVVYLSW
jgi:hypothetical protein